MTVTFEWGLAGVEAVAGADVAVVVDVLSFTTAVSVAADRGIAVLPYPWRDGTAAEFARDSGATLAVGRREAVAGDGVSLSPASIRSASGLTRLVLPSPNGSTLSHRLAGQGTTVVAACLRNATAVAGWLTARRPARVAVLAAGERWPDDSLRPALEDLLGAGAVIETLGPADLTPEALAARAAFRDAAAYLPDRLARCTSGRELLDGGFAEDVTIAAELDASESVPVLEDGVFRAAPLGSG